MSRLHPRQSGRIRGQAGYTLAELVMVCAVMVILASVALPSVKYTARRTKEMELRAALRDMRAAIDEYKRYSDMGLIPVDLGTDGYPKDLEILVDGVELAGQVDKKLKLLRRLPIDPMTGEAEWGLRSYQDEADATSWGGEDVFDVYSLSSSVGLNGVPYREW
ncbi:MAG TPA: prepilin-type N-terminal cleavage/methylation domain-containing protein [Thermoanaerobaculia bacterium]|jgi:general secretion pathway protein G|nr:prepilin-type N-terminal cleavage/methylation domain-containing protein [Thermoanaerobaculia bacterium]